MNKTFDCLIQGGEVFLENKIEKTDIVITNGKIIKIIKDSSSISATKIIDANNKWILPGAIDIHCHIRAPAFPERGTVLSETKAAVKGGITTLFEMPISNPCASTPEIIKNRKEHFLKNTKVNFGLIAALGKIDEANLNGLLKEGIIALKIFTITPPQNRESEFDGLCFVDEGEIFNALQHAKKSNLVVIFHAESQQLLEYFDQLQKNFSPADPKQHNATRPPIAESVAIAKILAINSYVGAKVHIAHVTSKIAAGIISYFQEQGQDLSAETCPHYLFKSEDDVIKHNAFGKINPPIREKNEQKELWNAINKNILTIVSSDHTPFSFIEKNIGKENFTKAPPGTPGGELLLPLMMNAALENKIKSTKVVELLSTNPAKRFGLYPSKGIIAENSDADLVLFDPHVSWKVNNNTLETKGKDCAHLFYEDEIQGKVIKTIINGKIIFDNGNFEENNDFAEFIRSN